MLLPVPPARAWVTTRQRPLINPSTRPAPGLQFGRFRSVTDRSRRAARPLGTRPASGRWARVDRCGRLRRRPTDPDVRVKRRSETSVWGRFQIVTVRVNVHGPGMSVNRLAHLQEKGVRHSYPKCTDDKSCVPVLLRVHIRRSRRLDFGPDARVVFVPARDLPPTSDQALRGLVEFVHLSGSHPRYMSSILGTINAGHSRSLEAHYPLKVIQFDQAIYIRQSPR